MVKNGVPSNWQNSVHNRDANGNATLDPTPGLGLFALKKMLLCTLLETSCIHLIAFGTIEVNGIKRVEVTITGSLCSHTGLLLVSSFQHIAVSIRRECRDLQ